jgi:ribonuclease Z
LPGNPADKQAWAKELGLDSLNYSTFISEGKMDMNDVIRPIYKEASESLGREFPYPDDKN